MLVEIDVKDVWVILTEPHIVEIAGENCHLEIKVELKIELIKQILIGEIDLESKFENQKEASTCHC